MDYFPSSSAGTCSSSEISQKPSGSSVLWAHLLRKDVISSPVPKADLPVPPLTPVDKFATSTRILLLDTQAHLQNFKQTVDDLTSKVDSAKHEIVTVKTLFQQDRELLVNDIVDRLNRSQLEIQKSIGQPGQASKLEDIQKNFELRLDGMDQRLNAMQMLHQTYSQTLQNQTHALRSLQDQQSIIIGALTPLLPLLQTIPPQIESARNDLSESLSSLQTIQLTMLSSHKNSSSPVMRPSSGKRSNSSSSAGRKRRRIDENFENSLEPVAHTITVPPIQSRNLPRATRTHRVMALLRPNRSQVRTTHRKPLAELPLTDYVAKPCSTTIPPGHATIPEHGSFPATPVIIPQTPLMKSSDHIARFRQGYIEPSQKQATERSPTVSIVDASSSHLPSSPYIPMPSISRVPRVQAPDRINLKSSFNPAAQIPLPARAPVYGSSHLLNTIKTVHGSHALAQPSALSKVIPVHLASPIVPTPVTITRVSNTGGEPRSTHPTTLPSAPPTLRQRRSPFREGRRFIPLDDSDTSSDEQRHT